jgi:quinol monooxygenase YgiN
MIQVVVLFDLHEGKRDAFLKEFKKLQPLVEGECGCIEYFMAVDVDTGLDQINGPNLDRLMLIERWESLEALKAHLVIDHMVAYRPTVADYIVKATALVAQPV